jgi:hypothetical protein
VIGLGLAAAALLLWIRAAHVGHGYLLAALLTCFVIVWAFVPALEARAKTHYLEKKPGSLRIDDVGVARTFDGGREVVTWAELRAVNILTTAEGPYAEDIYFVLVGENGRGCLVPHGLAAQHDLLGELERRLPGVDNLKVVEAMSSTDERSFTIWTRARR